MLKVVVNLSASLLPIGKPIIRLNYGYCKYFLNVRCLGDIYLVVRQCCHRRMRSVETALCAISSLANAVTNGSCTHAQERHHVTPASHRVGARVPGRERGEDGWQPPLRVSFAGKCHIMG